MLPDAETPVVELRGVARTFPGPTPVEALKPTDLVVRPGDYVSVIGSSGAGKSTLLHLLGLLDRPTSGTYLLDGRDTNAMSDAERTGLRGQRIGFVFQAFHLLAHRTALENVQVALLYNHTPRRERRSRAADALEAVGLSHRVGFFPKTLSAGEQQRVAIARALVTRPSLLLADEPTGNLDSVTSATVLDVFDRLHHLGLTIVMITHDADVSARADRCIRISDGVLTEPLVAVPR